MARINKKRLAKVIRKSLDSGGHAGPKDGFCVMEAVSYVSGEEWSDSPKCACPFLTSLAISINDNGTDKRRQKLKKLIPHIVGTRDGRKESKRRKLVTLKILLNILPPILRKLGLRAEAKKILSFKSEYRISNYLTPIITEGVGDCSLPVEKLNAFESEWIEYIHRGNDLDRAVERHMENSGSLSGRQFGKVLKIFQEACEA